MVQLEGSPHLPLKFGRLSLRSPLQSLRVSDDESVVLQGASQALWVSLPSNNGSVPHLFLWTKCRWLTPKHLSIPIISHSYPPGVGKNATELDGIWMNAWLGFSFPVLLGSRRIPSCVAKFGSILRRWVGSYLRDTICGNFKVILVDMVAFQLDQFIFSHWNSQATSSTSWMDTTGMNLGAIAVLRSGD